MQCSANSLTLRSLQYRGYGKNDGGLFFDTNLLELEQTNYAESSALMRAIADALWGKDPGHGAFCRLELVCAGSEVVIQRTRCPGVLAPWRTQLDVFVDSLRLMGNPSHLEAFLSDLLPWREQTRRWRHSLCHSATGHREASESGYHVRLLRRLAEVLEQTKHLPLLMLAVPPLAPDWRGRLTELAGKRTGYSILSYQPQAGHILQGLLESKAGVRRNA
jgi:hypothetical protein